MIIKKAQSMTEMVVLVVAMTVALLSLGRYMQRGYSGKIRSMADSGLGSQFDPQITKTQILNSQSGTVGYKVSFYNTTESGVVGSSSNRLYAKSSQVVGDYTKPMTSTRISRTSTAYHGEDAELTGLGMVAEKKVVDKGTGSTTNNDDKKVIDNNTKIDDKKVDDQSGKTTGDDGKETDIDAIVIPPTNYYWAYEYKLENCGYQNSSFSFDKTNCYRQGNLGGGNMGSGHYFWERNISTWNEFSGTPPSYARAIRCTSEPNPNGNRVACPSHFPSLAESYVGPPRSCMSYQCDKIKNKFGDEGYYMPKGSTTAGTHTGNNDKKTDNSCMGKCQAEGKSVQTCRNSCL